jgi:hypothetical protein
VARLSGRAVRTYIHVCMSTKIHLVPRCTALHCICTYHSFSLLMPCSIFWGLPLLDTRSFRGIVFCVDHPRAAFPCQEIPQGPYPALHIRSACSFFAYLLSLSFPSCSVLFVKFSHPHILVDIHTASWAAQGWNGWKQTAYIYPEKSGGGLGVYCLGVGLVVLFVVR